MSQLDLDHWLGSHPLPDNRSVEAFRSAVIAQLAKDFGWDLDEVKRVQRTVLELLTDEIAWGMERQPAQLFASFYRLDLGEYRVRNILSQHERPDAMRMLAEESLLRAAQKVWLRWTYSVSDSFQRRTD